MSIKIHFMRVHIDFFYENLGSVNEEKAKSTTFGSIYTWKETTAGYYIMKVKAYHMGRNATITA